MVEQTQGSVPAPVQVSVIMPAYNEQDAIDDAVADVQTHVLDHVPGSELVVVNDGSRDETGVRLDALAAADPRVRAIHQENAGHGGALLRGLSEARGANLFLIDSDRQIPLDAFPAFWAELQSGRDAVFGVRANRHDPQLRLLLTKFIRNVLAIAFGTRIHDANVPYKLFRRRLWEEVEPHVPADTLAPSLFLAVFARLRKYDVAEIDIEHAERATGEVSIKRWKLFKFCAKAFGQLMAFRRRIRSV